MADDERKAFFTTLPGILTGIAAVIVAGTTLYFGIRDRAQKEQERSSQIQKVVGESPSTVNPAAVAPAEAGPAAVLNPAASLEARRQQAERLVGEWLAALREHDVGHLVRLAETPYYFDQEILVSRESIADKYRELFKEKPTVGDSVQITKIRARTVGEMKEEGASLQRDRIFSSLSLSDQDWGIEVHARMQGHEGDEGMMMFARQVGNQLKIVGTWD